MDNTPVQEKKDKTFVDKIRDVSLRASGYSYIIGDLSMTIADRMNKDTTGSMTGLIYTTGGLVAAKFGKEHPEHQAQQLQRHLREYFQSQNIEIPKGAALNAKELAKPEGVIDHIQNFFYKYPSQFLCSMIALGSAFKVAGGFKLKGDEKTSTITYGALCTAAALIGLIVPEKEPDKEHPPTTLIGKTVEKIQESPLRAASAIYLVNNASLAVAAFKQRKQHLELGNKPGYNLTFLTVATYVIANILLGITTKDHVKATKNQAPKYIEALEQASAEVLSQVPEATRQQVIAQTAGHLASQKEVHLSADELTAAINQKIAALQKGQSWQTRTAATAETTLTR